MLLTYNAFYKQYGVMRSNQIVFPRVFTLDKLAFPLNSLFHFLDYREDVKGPDASLPYLKNQQKGSIIIDHAEQLHTSQLNMSKGVMSRRVDRFSISQVQDYQKKHKEFRYLREPWKKDDNPQHLLLLNYNFPVDQYQYSDVPLAEYQRWADLEQTLWDEAKIVAESSERQQYRILTVPDVLPSVSTLNTHAKAVTPNTLKILDQPEKWFILELWKWVGQLNGTTWWQDWKAKDLNKINLIFQHQGKWFVINMGYWHSFFEEAKKEDHNALNTADLHFKPIQLQKYMVRMLMQVQGQAVVADSDAIRTTDIEESIQAEVKTGTIHEEVVVNDEESVDKDLSVLETIEKRAIEQKLSSGTSHTQLAQGDDEATLAENHKKLLAEIHQEFPVIEQLKAQIEEQAEYGLMSAADYRALMRTAIAYADSEEPYGSGSKIDAFTVIDTEALKIKPDEITLPETQGVVDPSMLQSSVQVLDKKYIGGKFLQKDIVNAVSHIQKAGIVIQNHDIEIISDATGAYEQHRVKLKPIDGNTSVLNFRIPVIDEEGEFTSGGIKYRARRQKVDLPIRKIDNRTIVLSSYYGKLFIQRSEKKAYDLYDWIARQLITQGMTNPDGNIKEIGPADVFDNLFEAPRAYSGMARYIKSVKVNGDYYTFDHKQRESLFGPELIASVEQEGRRLVGLTAKKEPIIMTRDNELMVYHHHGQGAQLLGDLFTVFQLNPLKAPLDYIEFKLFTKSIPIGLVLGYFLGLDRLMALLNVKPKVIESNKRVLLAPDEWAIVFKDQKLIFSRKQTLATLVLSGFQVYEKSIKSYHRESFNQRNVYLNVFDYAGVGARYVRELPLLDQLFVDPITLEVLKEMHEPVTFQGLLYRAAELLLVDYHPDLQDMRFKRIRSYERVAGAIYKELAMSVREYKNRNLRSRPQLEMNPYAVWKNVSSQNDTAVKPPADINPLMYLKEKEAITVSGFGGQSKDAVGKKARAYHASEIGTTSEATSDSGDVGLNTYLSANPKLTSLRGMVDTQYEPKQEGATSLFSSQILLAPGSDKDSSTRLMMVGIQHGHTVSCNGYHQPYVRTGYEPVLAKRMGGMFGYVATDDGKVISKDEKALAIELKSGQRVHVQLGRQYGRSEGTTYPHDMVSQLRPGDLFKKTQVLAYNEGFFEPDYLDPSTITWKSGLTVTTALMEVSQTFEDSCTISKALTEKLQSKTTKVKSYIVEFSQAIRNLVKLDSKVGPMDTLLIIEDAVTNEAGLFDDETLQTLQKLSNHAPRAKVQGTIDRIEVFYHGDKADMSASLKALTDASDKRLAERCKSLSKPVITGRVTSEYRVEGTPLALNKAEIQIYITVTNGTGVGDKGVFANQMKTTFGEVMAYPVTTESGTTIDAIFSYRSITARVATSPLIIGSTATLLKVISQKAVALYRGQ